MPGLVWDEISSRHFESGLSNGVFYDSEGYGVPWNGLISIDEDTSSEEVSPYYVDGVKTFDNVVNDSYKGTLKAFTYPDELLEHEGAVEYENGFYAHQQGLKTFSLSYQTVVGNAVDQNLGHQIHILYDLTAVPSPVTNETITDTTDPVEFEWKIFGAQTQAKEFMPTNHMIVDSRYTDPTLFWVLGGIFYGSENSQAKLMSLKGLIEVLIDNWS